MTLNAGSQISKIEIHRYTLKPRRFGARPRGGALLRATFSDLEKPGISDLFPWEEFGDPSVETWIAELKNRKVASQTLQIALGAARDEALASSLGVPLVAGSIINHALASDPVDLAVHDVMEARRSTSPAIKIKIGRTDPATEAAALSRLVSHWGIRLRLDANERWTRDELSRFLDGLPIRIRETLEFIEDPFTFNLAAWSSFHRETGIALAYDRGSVRAADSGELKFLGEVFDSGAAQVLIHKPAWQNHERAVFARERGVPVVVTSILGHPVGNLWAASKAVQLAPDGVHGCKSHTAYRDDEASQVLIKSKQVRGSRVVGIGVGLGLQSPWFRRIKWEHIS